MNFREQGALHALMRLGFYKHAASVTSTILPRMSMPQGLRMHDLQLSKLKKNLPHNNLPANVNTSTPGHVYLSMMGKPGSSVADAYTQKAVARQLFK